MKFYQANVKCLGLLVLACGALLVSGCGAESPQDADLATSYGPNVENADEYLDQDNNGATELAGRVEKKAECTTDLDCVIGAGAVSACQVPSCNTDTFACVWHTKPNCCESASDCASDNPCTVGSCPIEGQSCMYQPALIDGCADADLEDNAGNDVDVDDANDDSETMDDDTNPEDEFNAGDDLDPADSDDDSDDESDD